MCLITEQTKPITATKDMVVYKVLWNKESLRFNAKWTEGKLKRAKLGIDITLGLPISFFFADCISQNKYAGTFNLTVISTGLHAYTTKKRNTYNLDRVGRKLHKMLIPAGSKIFKDSTGLIVSNQMILIK
jgi:hypothetical protein